MDKEKTKVILVEDDPVVMKNLIITLEDKGYDILATTESGEELFPILAKDTPDIIIMDINLAGVLDGIDVASLVKSKFNIPLLFLTSDRDHQTLERAKLTHPDGYLIKPFDVDALISSLEIAIHRHHHLQSEKEEETVVTENHIFVKVKNRLEKVQLDQINYIEANDIYSVLNTSDKKYILSYSLKNLEEKLRNNDLVRVHRSFIVNVKHIQAIEDNCIFINQSTVPIGKTYKDELMKRLAII